MRPSAWWFLSGAAAFHALTHAYYWVSGSIPLDLGWFTLTSGLNQIELWGSALLAVVFGHMGKRG